MANYHEGYTNQHGQWVGGNAQYHQDSEYASDNDYMQQHRRSGTPQRQPDFAHQQQYYNQPTHHPQQVGGSYQQHRKIPPQRMMYQQNSNGPYQEQRQGTPQRKKKQRSSSQNYQDQRYSTPQRARYHHQQQPQQPQLPPEYQNPTDHDQNMYQYQQQPRPTTAELREEDYNAQMLREREAEMLEINKKMHTVQDIYQDLAVLIDGQQELIDKIDESIDNANGNVNAAMNEYDEARLAYENPILKDPFGERIEKRSKRRKNRKKDKHRSRGSSKYGDDLSNFECQAPFKTIKEDLKDVVKDMKSFVMACTAPDIHENEYAYG